MGGQALALFAFLRWAEILIRQNLTYRNEYAAGTGNIFNQIQ